MTLLHAGCALNQRRPRQRERLINPQPRIRQQNDQRSIWLGHRVRERSDLDRGVEEFRDDARLPRAPISTDSYYSLLFRHFLVHSGTGGGGHTTPPPPPRRGGGGGSFMR